MTQDEARAPAISATSERQDSTASRRRFDALLRYTGGILFEFDSSGRYLDVCTADPSLLARPAAELVGRGVVEVLGEATGRPFIALIQRVLQSGRPEELEYVLDVPAGPRSFVATALPSGDSLVTLLVRDITAERQVKAQLAEAERLATVGLLAAAVGHEINNPLAFMANVISAIDCGDDLALSGAVAQLKDGTRRIASIVGSLRLLGPAGATEPEVVVELEKPLEAALQLTRVRIEDRAQLRIAVSAGLRVRGAEGKLCQVFVNLILNAVQAIVPGAPARNEIAVSIEQSGSCVRIRVTDTGVGIPEADMGKLFAPFFTTRPEQNGTGLGLYVTRKIVDSLGGSIAVRSEPGRGT
ncbi:MAG: sensor histidine kinase, partial [Myxococcaceae bacterium]